jgi:hypothetical protein
LVEFEVWFEDGHRLVVRGPVTEVNNIADSVARLVRHAQTG